MDDRRRLSRLMRRSEDMMMFPSLLPFGSGFDLIWNWNWSRCRLGFFVSCRRCRSLLSLFAVVAARLLPIVLYRCCSLAFAFVFAYPPLVVCAPRWKGCASGGVPYVQGRCKDSEAFVGRFGGVAFVSCLVAAKDLYLWLDCIAGYSMGTQWILNG